MSQKAMWKKKWAEPGKLTEINEAQRGKHNTFLLTYGNGKPGLLE